MRKVDPQYSKEAALAKAVGTALFKVVVGADGSVKQCRIVRGIGFGLDEMAEQAVRQWQFLPGTKDGVPVAVLANIEVNFQLFKVYSMNVGPNSLIFSLDPGVTRPELIKVPDPFKYPGHEDGPVTLKIEVDSEGNCHVLRAVTGTQEDIDAVTAYVSQWHFLPAHWTNQPVTVQGHLRFLVGLPQPKPAPPPTAPLP